MLPLIYCTISRIGEPEHGAYVIADDTVWTLCDDEVKTDRVMLGVPSCPECRTELAAEAAKAN